MKVMSWNIEGRLSPISPNRRGTPEKIFDAILRHDADVIFLPEACGEQGIDPAVQERLNHSGYEYHMIPYDDAGEERPPLVINQPIMMMLSRLPLTRVKTHRLGNLRNSVSCQVTDPDTHRPIRLIGVHLDDRSEAHRLTQMPDLISLIKTSSDPTVVMGDFNAMHGADLFPARLLRSRSMKIASSVLMPSMAIRAIEMARGHALEQLQAETDLRDADPYHRPTTTPKIREHEWLPSIRLIQIDHMFVSTDVSVAHFSIARDEGADHRAISAEIH